MYPVTAPPFLAQLFMQTKDGNGFSEDYLVDAEDYDTAIDVVVGGGAGATALVDARRALFTDKHAIIYVRVSDASKKRDTVIRQLTNDDGKGTYVAAAGDTEADDVALLVRFNAVHDGVPFFVLKPLRLIPEEVLTDNQYTPTANWNTAMDEYKQILQDTYKIVKGPKNSPSTETITSVQTLHVSRRKVGRPFGHSRGRLATP